MVNSNGVMVAKDKDHQTFKQLKDCSLKGLRLYPTFDKAMKNCCTKQKTMSFTEESKTTTSIKSIVS